MNNKTERQTEYKQRQLQKGTCMQWKQGRIQGAGGPAPYFWQSQFYSLHCIQCLKNIFEIKYEFYSGRNPRSFWKCGGVCVCVCESKSWPLLFFCFVKAPFWMISEAGGRLQEIASNFSNFGEAPAGARAFGARFGALPPYRAPFPRFLDQPLERVVKLQ